MGPLLMSGGRLCVEGTADISLWVNADGMAGWPSLSGGEAANCRNNSGSSNQKHQQQWEKYSITYNHNRLWTGDPEYLFTPAVNTTTSYATETLSYTSLVPSASDSGFVFYNHFYPVKGVPWPGRNVNFAMRYHLSQVVVYETRV